MAGGRAEDQGQPQARDRRRSAELFVVKFSAFGVIASAAKQSSFPFAVAWIASLRSQ
jgi:hypothetical protein